MDTYASFGEAVGTGIGAEEPMDFARRAELLLQTMDDEI
jgi:hypothetical protein